MFVSNNKVDQHKVACRDIRRQCEKVLPTQQNPNIVIVNKEVNFSKLENY